MALRRLKDCMEELHENQAPNLQCEATSAQTTPNCQAPKQYIRWDEVRDFLLMAEEALRAKDRAAQRAIEKAHTLGSTDEVEFLLSEIGKISEERASLQQRVQELVRANQSLTEEITIIRAQIEASSDAVPPSPGFPTSQDTQSHELAAERAAVRALEEELDALKAKFEDLQMKKEPQDNPPQSPRIRAGKNTNNKKKHKNKK